MSKLTLAFAAVAMTGLAACSIAGVSQETAAAGALETVKRLAGDILPDFSG